MDDAERRRHSRIRLDGRMVGRATVMADFRVAALSETGAALEMKIPMALGSRCDLSLALDDLGVDLKGRVVNVKPPEAGSEVYVVGVDFEGMSEVEAGALASVLERERRRSS
jgi:PilZ domain-containing protein